MHLQLVLSIAEYALHGHLHLLTQAPVDGHWGGVQFGVVVKKAALRSLLRPVFFSLRYVPLREIAESCACLTLEETAKQVSKMPEPFCIPTNSI